MSQWGLAAQSGLSLSPPAAPSSQELGGPPAPPKRWASDRKPPQNPHHLSYLEKPAACCEEQGWSLPQCLTFSQVFPISIPRARAPSQLQTISLGAQPGLVVATWLGFVLQAGLEIGGLGSSGVLME